MADEVVLESVVRGFCIPWLSPARSKRWRFVSRDGSMADSKNVLKRLVRIIIDSFNFAIYIRSNRPVKLKRFLRLDPHTDHIYHNNSWLQ